MDRDGKGGGGGGGVGERIGGMSWKFDDKGADDWGENGSENRASYFAGRGFKPLYIWMRASLCQCSDLIT